MACGTCGRHNTWHGSEEQNATPGSYLAECGCHDGVRMDDDEYAEGWQHDVIYPPCQFNPARCLKCSGTGNAGPRAKQNDCRFCRGTGWAKGRVQWPAVSFHPSNPDPSDQPHD